MAALWTPGAGHQRENESEREAGVAGPSPLASVDGPAFPSLRTCMHLHLHLRLYLHLHSRHTPLAPSGLRDFNPPRHISARALRPSRLPVAFLLSRFACASVLESNGSPQSVRHTRPASLAESASPCCLLEHHHPLLSRSLRPSRRPFPAVPLATSHLPFPFVVSAPRLAMAKKARQRVSYGPSSHRSALFLPHPPAFLSSA